MITPAWHAWARTQIGVQEIVGPQHNQAVIDYWKSGRIPLDVRNDETAWCAALVCAAIELAGYRSTRSGRARSYLEDRKNMIDCDERIGAIAVFSSPAGAAFGHVGLIESVGDTAIYVVGGNQGNQVSVAPFKRSRLLRVCWPATAPAHTNYPLAPRGGSGNAVSDR